MRPLARVSLLLGSLASIGCGPGALPWPGFGDEGGSENESSGSSEDESSEGEEDSSDDEGEDEGPKPDISTCPLGVEGCPCTPEGECEPGLDCSAGVCLPGNELCVELEAVRDARISQAPNGQPWISETNYGDALDLRIERWQYNSLYDSRALLHFELSELPAGLVSSATLWLSAYEGTPMYPHQFEGPDAFELRRVISAWDESSVSWEDQPATGPVELVAPAADDPFADYELDITAVVSGIVTDGEVYAGFELRNVAEGGAGQGRVTFASRESDDPQQHPRLAVCVIP